ncbi:probable pectate lyase 22 [Physcomitrium patens]|uniref:probable pectate lyase 22 n=1 Tax=Physcomitrium patens TaxID=3218 RepID=UPI003CCD718E
MELYNFAVVVVPLATQKLLPSFGYIGMDLLFPTLLSLYPTPCQAANDLGTERLEDKLSVMSVKIAFGYPNLGNNHFVTSPLVFSPSVKRFDHWCCINGEFFMQGSHVHCERVTALTGSTASHSPRAFAGDVSRNYSLSEDFRRISILRTIFRSIADFLEFPGINVGDKNIEQDRSRNLDNPSEDDIEVPEKFIDTSVAEYISSADNEEYVLCFGPNQPLLSRCLTFLNFNVSVSHKFPGIHFRRDQAEGSGDDAVGTPHLLMPGDTPYTCKSGNYIDDCWWCDPNWQVRRQALANCVIGFGQNATGGKNGKLYVVTSNKDDIKKPEAGTLRFGVTRSEPLWIIFNGSMTIRLAGELVMTSDKTIDGRGAEIHLVGSSQITIEEISNVIIHGIHIHDIISSGPHHILTAPSQHSLRAKTTGDAIQIKQSRHVWVDHCFLSKAADGLVDGTKNSTFITVSNCYFEKHNKVMLFGAAPEDDFDRNMQVIVAFNRFGPGLTQRMPRCRYGNCHVANNFYTDGWGLYAIGGSEDPTILSQANRFIAPDATDRKEVTSVTPSQLFPRSRSAL